MWFPKWIIRAVSFFENRHLMKFQLAIVDELGRLGVVMSKESEVYFESSKEQFQYASISLHVFRCTAELRCKLEVVEDEIAYHFPRSIELCHSGKPIIEHTFAGGFFVAKKLPMHKAGAIALELIKKAREIEAVNTYVRSPAQRNKYIRERGVQFGVSAP